MTFHDKTGSTRYDKLRRLISNEFSRALTLTPALAIEGQKTLFNLNDHNETYAIPERFQKFGPYNSLYVRNFGNTDIRVYLNEQRNVFADIPASVGTAIAIFERIPFRYVPYLRIENLSTTDPVAEGDVLIQVGNEVDSEELTILEMAGELNV